MGSLTIPNLLSGVSYTIQINAQDGTEVSGWSQALVVITDVDTIPPATPSAPVAVGDATYLNIQVSCNMLDNTGQPLAADMDYFECYIDTTSIITPTKTGTSANYVGNITCAPTYTGNTPIPANATFTMAATRPNDSSTATALTYYVAVKAVDISGNISALSAVTTVSVGLIDNLSIGFASITDANIENLTVTKLTAGSGVVNNFSIYSTLTVGISGTPGAIESFDYVAATSGWFIGASGLEINTGTITGATIQTSNVTTAPYVKMSSAAGDRIEFLTGDVNELVPGGIFAEVVGSGAPRAGRLFIESPAIGNISFGNAFLQLQTTSYDLSVPSEAILSAQEIFLNAVNFVTLAISGGVVNFEVSNTDVSILDTSGTWSVPRGTVASFTSGSTSSSATTADTALYSNICSTTIISGRRYRITAFWNASPSTTSATGQAQLLVHLGSGTGGASLAVCNLSQATTGNMSFVAIADFVGGTDVSAATHTFTMSANSAAGNLVPAAITNVANRPRLIIEDIGT